MPGYRTLAIVPADGAEEVHVAEQLRRVGKLAEAAVLMEQALALGLQRSPVVPGWLAGRLASLYRMLARYDDEVRMLEHYRESQVTDDHRGRYDARLSKARAIADLKRRVDSTATVSLSRLVSRR
ncbi:MAG: hypothetical protein ABJE47_12945 [bacterium]